MGKVQGNQMEASLPPQPDCRSSIDPAATGLPLDRRRFLSVSAASLGAGAMLPLSIGHLSPAVAQVAPTKPAHVRRVVTGHDANGRAIVKIDEICRNITSRRPGISSCVVWTTDSVPADNSSDSDAALRNVGTSLPNGTVFRIAKYEPGVAPRRHRTESIDYAVVISGQIDMELDGTEVRLNAGDVLVQRGTIHNWVNRGTEPCVIAFILVDAKPAVAGNKVLKAVEE